MDSKKPPDEVFEGPGFQLVRRGRYLEIKTNRTQDAQRELRERMRQSRPQILDEIKAKTAEFQSILHKYSSLDLVANLILRNNVTDPDKYRESESQLRPHWVEHAAVLELKDPQYQLRLQPLVEIADVERAHVLLEEIFAQTTWYYIAESAVSDQDNPPSPLDELRFITLMHGMSVRSPAYSSHWREVLLGLFGSGNAVEGLSTTQHVDIKRALAIVDAIEEHMSASLTERVHLAVNAKRDFLSRLKNYTDTGAFKGSTDEKELFDRVRNMRKKEAKRYLNYALLEWTRVALGTVLSFTSAQIAALASITVEDVNAFLDTVTVEFGATPSDYALPAPVNILHEKPVIRYAEGYFCPAPHLLPWCIKDIFEQRLKLGPTWNSYQSQRSRYLVNSALQYIKNMLPGAIAYQSLYYPFKTGEAELDGLVLFDRYAFLIEGKAGSLGGARRGGKEKIKTQLDALVGDAAEQVERAHKYIRDSEKPRFRLERGGELVFDKTKYSDRVLITVTLDVLDIFTADMHQMRDVGVVTTHKLPWAVALTDLRCISEILLRPFEFTHYLRWRLSTIGDASISGGRDELNWLGIYLKEGPKILNTPSGFTHLSFTTYTDDFDAFFLYKEGSRTVAAERPRQPLPRPLDILCDVLVKQSSFGFTELCECLLDLNFDERQQFARQLSALTFKDAKGEKAMFTFQCQAVSAMVTTHQLSTPQLTAEATAIRKQATNRVVIALSLTTSPTWIVHGWVVVRENS